MSIQLLDKTRKISRLLHNNESHTVNFNDICVVLSDILKSNIIVISKKGKVLGIKNRHDIPVITSLLTQDVGSFIDPVLNERLLGILSTKENVSLMTLGIENVEKINYEVIVVPVDIAGERLGTLFIYKVDSSYDIDDIILSEYGTTVVGLETMRAVTEETAQEERKLAVVHSAISTLSYSEKDAILYVFDEMKDQKEGVLVASRIADRVGITRSVIVNALRKFESAGVIEAKSSGMKGTYIKVVNDYIYDELEKLRENK